MKRISRNQRIVYLEAEGVKTEYLVRTNVPKAKLEEEARQWLSQRYPNSPASSLKLGFFPAFKEN